MKIFSFIFVGFVLACLAPAIAFSQVAVNGYYRAGGIYAVPSTGTNTLDYADRLRLDGSFASSDKVFGLKFRLQGNGSSNGVTGFVPTFSSASAIQYGFGYVRLFGGKASISAGKLDITSYEVGQHVGNYFLGNVFTDETQPGAPILGGEKGNTTGAIVQASPVGGLKVGVYSHIDGTNISTDDFGAVASYAIPNVGKVLVNSAFGNFAAANPSLAKSYLSAVFAYTAIKGLSASLGMRYDGETPFAGANNGAVGVVAIVEYTRGPLFVDLATDSDITNANAYVEGEADYTVLPTLKLRAYGAYDSAAKYAKVGSVANNEMFGGDLVFPVSTGAEIDAGVVYGNNSNIAFPVIVKVSF